MYNLVCALPLPKQSQFFRHYGLDWLRHFKLRFFFTNVHVFWVALFLNLLHFYTGRSTYSCQWDVSRQVSSRSLVSAYMGFWCVGLPYWKNMNRINCWYKQKKKPQETEHRITIQLAQKNYSISPNQSVTHRSQRIRAHCFNPVSFGVFMSDILQ